MFAFPSVEAFVLLSCSLPWLAMSGLVALIRRGRFAALQPTAFGGLSRRRRRHIMRALRRGDRLVPEDVPLAQDLVAALRKTRWLPWLFFVLPLGQLSTVTESRTQRTLWAITAAIWWLLAWWQFYLRHRVRLYAETHWST